MTERGIGISTFDRSGSASSHLREAAFIGGGVFLVAMIATFRTPILPSIGRDLSMTASQLGLATTAFAAGRLVADVPAGRSADRFPATGAIGAAAMVMGAASILMTVAGATGWMYLAFAVLGVGSALSNTTGMTYFSRVTAAATRGRALAVYSASRLVGQALGPMVSGLVAGWQGWRTATATAAGLGVIVSVALFLSRIDVVPGGRTPSRPRSEASPTPLSRTQLAVLHSVPFAMFYTFGGMAQTLVPIVGDDRLGLGASAIGLALGLAAVCRFAGTFVGGYVSDRGSRKLALVPGLVILAIGVALLGVAASPGIWLLAIVVMSLASFPNAVGATILGDHATGSDLGRLLGRFRFVGDMGLLVGPGVAGVAYQAAGGPGASLINAGLLIAVAVAALVLLPPSAASDSPASSPGGPPAVIRDEGAPPSC